MRTLYVMLVLGPCLVLVAGAQPPRQLNLMPMPSDVQLGTGQFSIDQSFSIALTGYREARLEHAVHRLIADICRRTGMPLKAQIAEGENGSLVIYTDQPSKEIQEPGEDESYTLEVTPSGAKLSALNPLGTFHGLETFLQLIEATPSGFAVPAIAIHDTPRFVWRGLMIDVSRHFMPLDVIRRNLDGMAAVKMNVFHWHLSDNQGFRVESKKYPKLHEMGSDGLYYTQDEVRDLIAYARDRGIRVVPEFDMPGHSTAWFVGYPELASGPGPYEIERRWGVFDPAIDPTQEASYQFLDEFIEEMASLFPDRYFHIGGDEVNGKQWSLNPRIQIFMRSNGIKDNQELQAYFTTRVQKIVSKHNKIMVGWDEILTRDIPKNIVIQSWRGTDSLAAAAREGYQGLLSNGYYIDLIWPASRHYAVDPLGGKAAELSPAEKQRILGGEATMWSEFVSPENIDSRIWPRTAAIAERFWSPEGVRDVTSMYERLREISWRLDFLGLTHRSSYIPMLQRIANREDVTAVRVLADVVEPVKDYHREELARIEPRSMDPLNRMVDTVRPESETARLFSNRVNAFVAGRCRDATNQTEIRKLLVTWRDHQAKLPPERGKSFLLGEVEFLSRNLLLVSASGLSALDYLDNKTPVPEAWKRDHLALIENASKPGSAQLLLMITAPIAKLIDAVTSGGACQAGK
jgi:hexosaminidase